MTEQQTRDLIAHAQSGMGEAEAQLLQAHLGLVKRVARDFWRSHGYLPNDDLLQEGRLGLLKAVRKFDLERRTPSGLPVHFSTCATKWILRCMQLAVNRQRPWHTLSLRRK